MRSCWITLSLKKLRSSLLQRHPVSVPSLWLSILTLIVRNTLSFVYIASYQAISQVTQREFTIKHKFMQSLYTCFVHLFSAFPSKRFQNYNLLFIHIKNATWSSALHNVTVLLPLWYNILIKLLLLSVTVAYDTVQKNAYFAENTESSIMISGESQILK